MESRTPARQRREVISKRACKNLSNVFNQSGKLYRYRRSFSVCEFVRLRRERLKSQYHHQPHPFFGKNTTCNAELFTCETGDGKPNLRKQLQAYVARRNSPTNILGTSKCLLKQFINSFPPFNFSKYLMKPERNAQILEMSSGKYLHFGIRQHLRPQEVTSEISINIGLYAMESFWKSVSRTNYFTIIGKQLDTIGSFVIGIYCGSFPIEIIANEILQPLVAEIKYLKDEGISIGNHRYCFLVNRVICDPVAYSLATCTSMPDSMYGCSKCKSQGNFSIANNTTSYPIISSELRDDDDFKFCVASEHHIIPPVIAEIDIGLISQVSIDYRYFVCLGVMKKMIHMWITGDVKFRLNRCKMDAINQELVELTSSCPAEFQQQPKPLDSYMSWTAYDFRQFLLYYGPIVLQGHLTQITYVHFLHLNMAMRIALDAHSDSDVTYFLIDNLLKSFVKDFASIYGYESVDYNVHNLLHVGNVARKNHCVENVGGFQFESIMKMLEAMLGKLNWSFKWHNKLADTVFRWNQSENATKQIRSIGPIISTEEPNNYYITTKGIMKLQSMKLESEGEIVLYGYRFLQSLPFTCVQTSSQNILIIKQPSSSEKLKMDDIICKAIVLKNRGKLYAMPLLRF